MRRRRSGRRHCERGSQAYRGISVANDYAVDDRCALNTGRSPTACRTGHIDPLLPFKFGPTTGRNPPLPVVPVHRVEAGLERGPRLSNCSSRATCWRPSLAQPALVFCIARALCLRHSP